MKESAIKIRLMKAEDFDTVVRVARTAAINGEFLS